MFTRRLLDVYLIPIYDLHTLGNRNTLTHKFMHISRHICIFSFMPQYVHKFMCCGIPAANFKFLYYILLYKQDLNLRDKFNKFEKIHLVYIIVIH